MKKLYRSKEKMIAGVCGGIGEYFNVDSTLIRLALVAVGILSGIIPFMIFYLIAWIIIPSYPNKKNK